MRNAAIALLAAAALFSMCACNSNQEEPTPAAPAEVAAPASPETAPATPAPAGDDKVLLAVNIAKEIADDPDHAAEILGRHGMTEKQFEAMLFDIAADPDLSRRYSAEMER